MFFLHLRQKNFNYAPMPSVFIEIKKVKKTPQKEEYKLEMEGVQTKDIRSYRVWGVSHAEEAFLKELGIYDECKGEMTCLYMYPKDGETRTKEIIVAESMVAFSGRLDATKVMPLKN